MSVKTNEYPIEIMNAVGFCYKNPIKPIQVYNLFSNFGNISMIMITKK